MKRASKRTAAIGMLLGGVMTVGTGVALEGVASAHPQFDATQYDFHLFEEHHDSSWEDFKGNESDCDNAMPTEATPYAWHFVVPSDGRTDLGDLVEVDGMFDQAGLVEGGHVVQNGKGWYLYTATADTLVDAVGNGTVNFAPTPERMNLSHTCGPDTPQGSSSSSESSSSGSSSSGSSSSESSSSESSSSGSSSSGSSSSGSSSSGSSSSGSSSSGSSSSQTSSSQTSTSQTSSTQSTQTSSTQSSSSSLSSSVLGSSTSRSVSSDDESSSAQSTSVLGTSTSQASSDDSSVGQSTQGQSPAVLGVQTTRLPRTGVDPGLLLMVGGLAILSGILMLRYADR